MNVDFNAKQREFAAYIRNPLQNPTPADVPEARMAMYRELFFNNIDNFLASNFPVIRTLLDDRQWFELAQDFFSRHVAKSPYFSEIPEEFIAFLQEERNNPDDFPFLLELAHYEWVEMALSIAKEEPVANPPDTGDLLNRRIKLSPLAWPLVYQYPVHQISPSFLPSQAPAQATCLVAYRNLLDDVHFLEITAMTYRLLALVEQNQPVLTGDCLRQIVAEMQSPEPEKLIDGALQVLVGLAEKNIINIVA